MRWLYAALLFTIGNAVFSVGPIQRFIQYSPSNKQPLRLIMLANNVSEEALVEKNLRYLATPRLKSFLRKNYAYRIESISDFKNEYQNLHFTANHNDTVVILIFNQRGLLLSKSIMSSSNVVKFQQLRAGIIKNRRYLREIVTRNDQRLLFWAHQAYLSNLCLYSNSIISRIRTQSDRAVRSLKRLNKACIDRTTKN